MTARKRQSVSSGKKPASRGVKKRSSQIWKKFRKFIYAGVGICVLVICVYGFRALVSGSWDGPERYNLLLGKEGERIVLVSLSASDEDMLVLVFDPKVVVQAVHGYGDYKVGSLLKLGKIEGLGSSLLEDSISSALGMKIHGYLPILVTDEQLESDGWYKNLWQKMLFSLIGTKVGITDVSRYFEASSGLRSDQVEIFSIHESRLAFTEPDIDGVDLYYVDPLRLDGYLQDRLSDIVFLEESIGLSVINTTSTPGLASSFSRPLLSTGIDVVGVSENSTNREVTTILIRDETMEDSNTFKYVQSLIPYALVEKGEVDDFRSDMVVLLGKDYSDFLYEKK